MAPNFAGTLKRPAASSPRLAKAKTKARADDGKTKVKAKAKGVAARGKTGHVKPMRKAALSAGRKSPAKVKKLAMKAKTAGKAKAKAKATVKAKAQAKAQANMEADEDKPKKRGKTKASEAPVFLSFPGAGGSRSRHAVLEHFGTLTPISFSRVPNLTTIKLETPFLEAVVTAAKQAAEKFGEKHPIYLVGHSFGSRVIAHTLVRKDVCCELPRSFAGAILFGYPLVHPKQARQEVLKALDPGIPLLFLSGCRDSFMGDFSLLRNSLGFPTVPPGELTAAADAPSWLLMALEGCGHGLDCSAALEEVHQTPLPWPFASGTTCTA